MYFYIMEKHSIEATTILLEAPIRYGEEDMPNDAPFRKGDMWYVSIDIATGKIKDWPNGKTLSINMKVCDMGTYRLMNADIEVATIEEDYVPSFFPGEHYGDYIEFDIDANGVIANWKDKATEEGIQAAFFDGK